MSPVARARVYLRLGRVSNLPTVWTNVLCGMALSGARVNAASAAVLGVAMTLMYAGGMFLNDAFDQDIDARERPERPIPAGLVRAREVFVVGYGLLAGGVLLVGLHAAVAGRGFAPVTAALLLAGAIVLYDAWHKKNPLSPLLMSACRVLVYVVAALSTGGAGLSLFGGALSLGFYLIGLTAVAKQERRLTVRGVAALGFLAVPFLYTLTAPLRGLWGFAAYAALCACAAYALRVLRGAAPDRVPRAVVTLIAGISLLDAALLAQAGAPGLSAVAMLSFPCTLGLQRLVRGT